MTNKTIKNSDCKQNPSCLLCTSSEGRLSEFYDNKNTIFIKKGQSIYIEGARPQGIFCLFQGKVKIVRSGSEGKEQITHLAKNGDLIGLNAFFIGKDYTDTAVTLEDSYLCQISKQAVEILIQENPLINISLRNYLCKINEEMENKILNLSQRSVRERLAINILYLNEYFGILDKNQVLIDLPLSREDLANLVGTATETVIRILSDFKKEGILCFNGKRISITDINSLRKVAEVYF